MKNIEKTELFLSGYIHGLVGNTFTQANLNTIMSHIDDMLHEQNATEISDMLTESFINSLANT